MLKNITSKQKNIIVATISVWSVILIGSGVSMTLMDKPVTKTKNEVKITQKRVANMKSNEILPKNMSQEINQPISVDVKDYLENVEDIEDSVLEKLKLDTSMVNINEAGSDTYTITYKKKKFNGTFEIKEKELPDMVLTLKTLNLEIGSILSTDISTYVAETLTDEVKNNTTLDIVLWNIDTLDWKLKNYKDIANRVIGKVEDGDIVLMHDIHERTLKALEIILPKLKEEGYQFVTVSELKKAQELRKYE